MPYILCGELGKPLPRLSGTIALCRADKTALAVLICLAQSGENATKESIARDCDCSEDDVTAALTFLKKYGIITETGDVNSDYDTTTVPQSDGEFSELLHECAQIVGVADVNFSELGDFDVLRRMAKKYDSEYIVCLTKYYKDIKKDGFHFAYIEKVARSLEKEKGISDAAGFSKFIESKKTLEGAARRLFGLGSTALSENQNRLIDKWTSKYGYDKEIFGKAYDIMADCASKRSFNYIDTILTHWHDENCRTADDVAGLLEKEANERAVKKPVGKPNKPPKARGGMIRLKVNSFDPKEAFAQALKRSQESLLKEAEEARETQESEDKQNNV